jgi:hypothetical protein
LQPAIDLATAIRVYGGNPPPWMTLEYAFEALDADTGITPTGNVTAETNAYSAYLDCQTFSPSESSATYSNDESGASVSYNMNDRGCQVSGFVTVSNTTSTYASTWNTQCSGSAYGRIGIFAGIYSDASSIKIANYSLISCVSSSWLKPGSITVSLQPNGSPQFVSFTPSNSTSIHSLLYQTLEDTLSYYTLFDPSDTIHADAFGFSVLSYAQAQSAASPITPDLIKNSTEDLFTTLYAGLAVNLLLQQAATPQTANGELSIAVTRLYMVALLHTQPQQSCVFYLCATLPCSFMQR